MTHVKKYLSDFYDRKKLIAAVILQTASFAAGSVPALADGLNSPGQVRYRTENIQGADVFYREAGPRHAPTVLLLHGFPTSSHMFRDLIPELADRYHVIAPDYPGFGQNIAGLRQNRTAGLFTDSRVRGFRRIS